MMSMSPLWENFQYENYFYILPLLFLSLFLLYQIRKIFFVNVMQIFINIFILWATIYQVITSKFDSVSLIEYLRRNTVKDYISINLFIVKYIILYSPEHIQVLLSDSGNNDKSISYAGFRKWFDDALFMRNDNSFRERKKILLPCFNVDKLQIYLPIIEENGRELVQNMEKNGDKEFRIMPLIKKCIFDNLYDTILGIEKNSNFRKNSLHHSKVLAATFHPLADRAGNFLLSSDAIFYLTSNGRKYRRNKEILREITKQIVNEKLRQRNEDVTDFSKNQYQKISMLDHLLDVMEKNSKLTLESIYQEVEFFLGAGHDTSSMAICWSLFLLGKNLDIQRKVQNELKEIFGEDRIRAITNDDLKEMRYLECVIKEVMRLHPPISFFSRKIKEFLNIDDKVFTKQWTCIVSIFHLHRNPRVFENPEKFDPDRFLPENASKIPPYGFIPFSLGTRMCIGNRLAMMSVKVILATILRNCTVETVVTEVEHYFRISLNPARPIILRIKPNI